MFAISMRSVSYLPALRPHICGACASRPVLTLPEISTGGHVCLACSATSAHCAACGAVAFDSTDLNLYHEPGEPVRFLCDDCLPDTAALCEHCGDYFPRLSLNDAHDTRGNACSVCNECLKEAYAACDCCGEYYPAMNLTGVFDGDAVCDDCLSDSYFFCEDCEEWYAESDACAVHNERGEQIYVCEDCRDRYFTRCDDCGEYFPADAVFRTVSGDYVCEDCRENYCFCERCGELVPLDAAEYIEEEDGYFCSACASELDPCGERLHEYSYKPSPSFHRTDADTPGNSLYFGVELELSHESREDCGADFSACHDILNPDQDEENIYTKKDGTLRQGFEIVSHPRTLSSWHEFAPTLQEYFDQAAEYTRGDRDGLHVHISRKGMTEAHALRFGAFINACQDELMPIARRRSEWSAYADKPKTGAACKCIRYTGNRYRAVNWCNSATVELRIFRATIDLTEFMSAVEFSHAAYQFTKRSINTMQILRGEAWPAFLAYLRDNAARYGSLIALLQDAYSNPEAPRPEFFAALGKEKRAAA